MPEQPAIKKDTFGGDLANALLLRPPYRKPALQVETPRGTKKTYAKPVVVICGILIAVIMGASAALITSMAQNQWPGIILIVASTVITALAYAAGWKAATSQDDE